MSIRFRCPNCKTIYTVVDRDAGKKAKCKECGQLVQVPSPPPTKAVLGELLADDDSEHPSLDDLSRARAAKAKKAAEAPYRRWMVPGEELTQELKEEIHRYWRKMGIHKDLTDPVMPPTEEYYDPAKHGRPRD